ncbi:MAG: flagellar export chaperone FliS [Proteobacteria bacterium]|nr:flagellar export chaperone FliS [Pseudomonadota bacterium]MBU1686218.1 flagellar export chaperone FliS [Pseudomonadota bacterium]
MAPNQVLNAYRRSEMQSAVHPVKLIHMLFERVLIHLEEVSEGIREGNAKRRGENLGKAIAIVTELAASIKSSDQSEAAAFLRGLYTAILTELPRVSLDNDEKIVGKAYSYLKRLKEIWEETAMDEHGYTKTKEGGLAVQDLNNTKESLEFGHNTAAQEKSKASFDKVSYSI